MADKIDFDVTGARAAGYTDDAIAEFLGQRAGMDVAGAMKAGYTPSQIIDYLVPKPQAKEEAPAPKPAPKAGILDDLERGLQQARSDASMLGAAVAGRNLSAIEAAKAKADRGEFLSPFEREQVRQYDEAKANTGRQFGENVGAAIDFRQKADALPVSPGYKAFKEAAAEGTVPALKAFWKAPGDVLLSMMAEGLPASVPALGAAVATGPVGGTLVAGGQSYLQAYAGKVVDLLAKKGIDINDRQAVMAALSDPAVADNIRKEAALSAIPQGAAGAAGMAIGAKTIAPASLAARPVAQQAVNIPVQAAAQGAIAAAGEAGSQAVIGEPIEGGQVVAAGIGGAAQAPMDVAAFTIHRGVEAAQNRPRTLTPEDRGRARALDVMDAPDTDSAIRAARDAIAMPQIDAIATQAREFGNRQEQDQAAILKLFGGLNQGTVERDVDGGFHYATPDGRTMPLKVWDGKAGDGTIPPAVVSAQKSHYERMGVRVVYFEDAPHVPFDGAVDPSQPDTIFLSSKPERNAAQVGAHELTHVLESTVLPDGTNLGDLLHEQVRAGITEQGWEAARRLFDRTAPDRSLFPDGARGDSLHADAVATHLIKELGAELGAEAPKFQTFLPKVVDALQVRYGDSAAAAVVKKLLDGIRQAARTLREFFFKPEDMAEYGQPPVDSQHWVTNLDEIHDTLAKMYAQRFGTQAEKENAALRDMRDRARREEGLRVLRAPPTEPPPPTAPVGFVQPERPASPPSTSSAPSAPPVASVPERIGPPPSAAYGEAATKAATYRRWLADLDQERRRPDNPEAVAAQREIDTILGKVRGVEGRLTKAAADRLAAARARLEEARNPTGDSEDMARVREALAAERRRMAQAASVGTGPSPGMLRAGQPERPAREPAPQPQRGRAVMASDLPPPEPAPAPVSRETPRAAAPEPAPEPAAEVPPRAAAQAPAPEPAPPAEGPAPASAAAAPEAAPRKARVRKEREKLGLKTEEPVAVPQEVAAAIRDAEPGLRGMAQRQVNARENMIETIMERGDMTREQAAEAFQALQESRSLNFDGVGGRYTVKHGRMMEADFLRKMAGVEPVEPPKPAPAAEAPAPDRFANNKLFTADKVEAARARLRAKLAQVNSGFDPEVMLDGLTIAGAYVEAGVRDFASFAKAMVEDLGAGVRPYLLSFYEGARNYPGLDTEGMTPQAEAARLHAAAMKGAAASDAVGEVIEQPRQRERATGKGAGRTLRQDWGVEMIDGYTPVKGGKNEDADLGMRGGVKDAFLADAKAYLREVAAILEQDGFTPYPARGSKKPDPVSVNAGGPAVSGDVLLSLQGTDGRGLYAQIGATALRGTVPTSPAGVSLMFRVTQNENRFGSGTNRWAATDLTAGELAATLRQAVEVITPPKERTNASNQGGVAEGNAGKSAEGVYPPQGERPARGDAGQPGGEPRGERGRGDGQSDRRLQPAEQPEVRGRSEQASPTVRNDAVRGAGDGAGTGDRANRQPLGDYRYQPGELARDRSWRGVAERNVEAVELAKKIAAEGRPATPEERALLARFTGWGASEIANGVFPDPRTGQFKANWQDLGERLRAALTDEEYAAARRTTQYAHYTSEGVIRSIYSALERLGFGGGKVLEPGMGIGLFKGLMPDGIAARSQYHGIEYDPLTGMIAKALYPQSNIQIGDFTETALPKGYYDAAIGNPPFSGTKVMNDPEYRSRAFMLHDYFFAKTIDRVKPGGLVVFVTSKGTMDKGSSRARQYLADRADLLGAIRLPQTAFKDNAGTEVVTDVLFLQKREPGAEPNGTAWLRTKDVETPQGPTAINEYFADHPEMVLGEHALTGSMYRQNEYTVVPRPGDIEQQFAQAVRNLPEGVYRPQRGSEAERAAVIERDFNPTAKKEGSVYVDETGQLRVLDQGSGAALTERVNASGKTVPLKPKEVQFLKDYVGLRDALKQAQHDQLNDGNWEKSLKALNKAYRDFVKAHGPILAHTITERENPDGSTTVTTRWKNVALLRLDAENALAYALEEIRPDGTIVRGKVLEGRTLNKPTTPVVNTVQDALLVQLNQQGKLDMREVGRLAGMTEAEAIEQLGPAIYHDPSTGWTTADAYLSGNVVRKLKEARQAAKTDPSLQRNVAALEAVQPAPLAPADITAKLGAHWIPASDVAAFASDVIGERMDVRYSPLAKVWSVEGQGGNVSEWNPAGISAPDLLEKVLNSKQVQITRREPDGNGGYTTVVDPQATEAANAVAKKMDEQFQRWLWNSPQRSERLARFYNENFNNIVPRSFDGQHLTLPGISSRFDLYPHQKRAIWRVIQDGNTYLAHSVGAGKTFTMIAAGMEERRLGLIKKPMYVVPNHMLAQFAREFQELYPTAHVMVADEENFHTANRRQFVARAALNDPDAIIITHSAFGRIGVSEEFSDHYVQNLIDHYNAVKEEVDKGDRVTVKQIERRIEALEKKLSGKADQSKKDKPLTFEELGVDRLYVDEFHEFRKLDFATNRGNVKGIDPSGSQRAMDLHMKVEYLEEKNPGRTLVAASGTPVTNTMGELYTAQRFMQPHQLREDGLDGFDAWSNQFGEVVNGFEQNAAGGYEVVSRFSKFVNVPDLMRRVRSFMDILTSEQLGDLVKRPTVQGGGREIVVTPSPDGYKAYQQGLEQRIKNIRARRGPPKPGDDIILSVISDGRFSAIDMRFVDPTLPSDPNSKLNRMLDDAIRAYHDTGDFEYHTGGTPDQLKGGTQMIFTDLGLGEASARNRGFNMKDWITQRLFEGGVDPNHIAFMRDNNAHAKKEKLFADMRQGKKRILIGGKDMETGVNAQKRLTHLFHLDAPWFPASVEQREGRIIRQGNQNKAVTVKAYATKGSYDSTMWGMNARKQRFITQAMQGNDSIRSMEDVSEASSFEMASALASGDERYLKMAGLRSDVERLGRLYSAHEREQRDLRSDLVRRQSIIESRTALADQLKEAMTHRTDIAGDAFAAVVDGKPVEDREDFGNKLFSTFKALAEANTEGEKVIGKIGGFDLLYNGRAMKGSGDFAAVVDLDIPGQRDSLLTYPIDPQSSIKGLAARATNQVNSLDRLVAEATTAVAEAERRVEQIKSRLGAGFPDMAELTEKQAALDALQTELAKETEQLNAAQDQAAQTENPAPPSDTGIQFSPRRRDAAGQAPPFYSALERAIETAKIAKGTPGQWEATIRNMPGVKPEEREWVGLDDWLRKQPKAVTKEQVLDYVRANRIEVREVMRGGDVPDAAVDALERWVEDQPKDGPRANGSAGYSYIDFQALRNGDRDAIAYLEAMGAPDDLMKPVYDALNGGATKYQQYTLPGGRNYRELLLTLPERINPSEWTAKREARGAKADIYAVYDEIGRFIQNVTATSREEAIDRAVNSIERRKSEFRGSHWDEPNVLAHVRFDDRTGPNGERILHVAEVQSDWHQAGRKKGYTGDAESKDIERRLRELGDEYRVGERALDDGIADPAEDKRLRRRMDEIIAEMNVLHDRSSERSAAVPNAPFKTTWPELAFKRVLRYAAENGYDRVSWDTGETNADRYDLSKHITAIDATREDNSAGRFYQINAHGKGGRDIVDDVYPAERLPDVVGKELADRIVKDLEAKPTATYSGLDLKVGGEGMTAFYDKQLPIIANKLGKKFGAKVEDTTVLPSGMTFDEFSRQYRKEWGGIGDEMLDAEMQQAYREYQKPAHSIPITDAMRASVMQGQPLFSPRTTGDSGREYTPEQRAAFEAVGRTVDRPSLWQRMADAREDLGRKLIRETLDPYIGLKADQPEGYVAARLANSTAPAQAGFIELGTLKFDGNTYAIKERNGGVQDYLARPLRGEADDFLWWVAANRAERLQAEDRENLFGDTDIRALKALNRGELDFDYTMLDGRVTRSRREAYADSLAKLDKLNRNLMDLAVQSGLVKEDQANALLANPFYVPFYRVAEQDGTREFGGGSFPSGFVKQYAFKKLKGGTEKLNDDLWDNYIGNASHMIDAALRNRAATKILDTSVRLGSADEVSAQDYAHRMTKAERASTAWTMKDGERVYYAVHDPMVFKAVSALETGAQRGPLMEIGRWFARTLRAGVTANPLFALRMLIRDTENTIAIADVSPNPIKNLRDGFAQHDLKGALQNLGRAFAGRDLEAMKLDPEAANAFVGGAVMRLGSGQEGGIRRTTSDNILDTPDKAKNLWRRVAEGARAYKEVAAVGEDINRLAVYRQAREAGMPHDVASFTARDIQDFTLHGAAQWVRVLTDVTPFLNARMQGLYKIGRVAADSDRSVLAAVTGRAAKSMAMRAAAILGAMVLADLALDSIYRDDEDYKKRTEDDRNLNYWFKIGDTQFRIPKGFELAALSRVISTGAEVFFDKEMTGRRWVDNFWNLLGTNLQVQLPAIAQPLYSLATNTTPLGRVIEPRGMERLEPQQRYTINNTLAARGVSSAMNAGLRAVMPSVQGLSPMQIDYLVNAYGGWAATTVLGAADRLVRQFVSEPERPTSDLLANLTQGMVRNDPSPTSRYVELLYSQGREVEQAYATYMDLVRRGMPDEARSFLERRRDDIVKHGAFSKVIRTEGEINQQIRLVTNDPNLSGEQKRVKIMQLQAVKNRLAERLFAVSQ